MPNIKTRNQEYALMIYKQVKEAKQESDREVNETYGQYAHKLPIMIYTEGLVNALSFV